MDGEGREKWEMQLMEPLPGQERVESQDVAEMEMAAFKTLMRQTS